jgi:small-conductance mechanosensitive channel
MPTIMNILNPKNYDRHSSGRSVWMSGYVLLALVSFAFYFLLDFNAFDVFGDYLVHLKKFSLWVGVAGVLLIASRFIERGLTRNSPSPAARYNFIRFIRLMTIVIILMIGASLLFENWYTAAVSLGLISLLLGFALQTPISSLIGWIYIVIRTPYHVGDRIQLTEFTGDVVEINYLDTTLWEFGGGYLTNDLPSGRLIRFPNSLVLQSAVYNYSWRQFPYIWNEIPFHFAYESNLKFIEEVIKRVAKEELDQTMDDKIDKLKKFMEKTPISKIDIKEYPSVTFRINANTWVEAIVTYLVDPKKATDTRSRIIKRVLEELLKEPDKALFPKSNAR